MEAHGTLTALKLKPAKRDKDGMIDEPPLIAATFEFRLSQETLEALAGVYELEGVKVTVECPQRAFVFGNA